LALSAGSSSQPPRLVESDVMNLGGFG
jgi:hypothetical protein